MIDSALACPAQIDWRQHAACRSAEPDVWFPDGSLALDAKRICRECPVRRSCAQYGCDLDTRFGIWGGFDLRFEHAALVGWLDADGSAAA